MASPKQRAANKANALKSTGPKSDGGKRRASVNATKHTLSLPIDERAFETELRAVVALIRDDCDSDSQALELARRIIDYERNEAFLIKQSAVDVNAEIKDWAMDSHRFALNGLVQQHQNKERVPVTFTTPNKRPKGKERTQEIKFIEDFLKLQNKVILGKARNQQATLTNSQRHQKRAINQLVKGVRAIASGSEI
jgi:hypothetical protein